MTMQPECKQMVFLLNPSCHLFGLSAHLLLFYLVLILCLGVRPNLSFISALGPPLFYLGALGSPFPLSEPYIHLVVHFGSGPILAIWLSLRPYLVLCMGLEVIMSFSWALDLSSFCLKDLGPLFLVQGITSITFSV